MDRLTEIRADRSSRTLILRLEDGRSFRLPFEYLRVFSPSAEVGHQSASQLLIAGKEEVNVTAIEPVGNYAIRIIFDDGHDSGLYSWPFLMELAEDFENRWANYKSRIAKLYNR